MADVQKKLSKNNTWLAKLKRTATSLLPIDKNRRGQCKRCGACCKLPNICPFLRFNDEGLAECKIYLFRPLNCRKYPRTESELITSEICGYTFGPDNRKLSTDDSQTDRSGAKQPL